MQDIIVHPSGKPPEQPDIEALARLLIAQNAIVRSGSTREGAPLLPFAGMNFSWVEGERGEPDHMAEWRAVLKQHPGLATKPLDIIFTPSDHKQQRMETKAGLLSCAAQSGNTDLFELLVKHVPEKELAALLTRQDEGVVDGKKMKLLSPLTAALPAAWRGTPVCAGQHNSHSAAHALLSAMLPRLEEAAQKTPFTPSQDATDADKALRRNQASMLLAAAALQGRTRSVTLLNDMGFTCDNPADLYNALAEHAHCARLMPALGEARRICEEKGFAYPEGGLAQDAIKQGNAERLAALLESGLAFKAMPEMPKALLKAQVMKNFNPRLEADAPQYEALMRTIDAWKPPAPVEPDKEKTGALPPAALPFARRTTPSVTPA